MGVYRRPDSPYWYLWIENAPPGRQREKTKFRIGTTKADQTDSRRLAQQLYAQRMHAYGAQAHGVALPPPPAVSFATLATWYDTHVIAQHKGREREREILPRLIRDFGQCRIDEIDATCVIEWRTARLTTATRIEGFGARGQGRVPRWRQIHAYLRAHGPTSLTVLAQVFAIRDARQVVRTFSTPQTRACFTRVHRGVWAAVGAPPPLPVRVLPPPSARTVNREVDLLQQILAAGVPKYYAVSPLAGLADLDVTPPVRRTMHPDEERRVLAALEPVDRAILLMGLDTLTRLGDILDLQRTDDHGETITVRDPKSGSPHTVPVSTRLRAALDAVPIDPRHPTWYFPVRRRGRTEHARRRTIARALARACHRADVPYGRARHGLTFHWATRRTGATRMIRAGGDKVLATVQRIGDWKTLDVLTGIYQEVVTEDMRAAVESVAATPATLPTSGRKSSDSA